jgi:hypothetical protein
MKYICCLSVILLINISCRKKCTEEISTKRNLDPELDAYFGVFKMGNYWVYENQNQTKRDSIYVTAYERNYMLFMTGCHDIETLNFTLKATGHDVVTRDSICMSAYHNELSTQSCPDSLFFNGYGYMHFSVDTITYLKLVSKCSSVVLNNQLYVGNLIQIYGSDTLYMQKGIGIVGWKKNNDTYNLVKKNVQL